MSPTAMVTGNRRVEMLDLRAEFRLYERDVRSAIDAVLDSGQFIGGPAVAELERAVEERYGIAHAVAVSSGTDAILCVLMALGIGPGDEVIVPSFTFFATAGCVARVGARPVFVDIDPRTFNLDASKIEAAVTPRTKAIIPVHLYGQCAEMDPICETARRHGLTVIEDAAQAIGAQYKGRFAGTLGNAAVLSFYPTKNLGGFGEGGMILTADEELAAMARQLRTHGESARYCHDHVGGNFRLDTMKAAILRVKLNHLDDFTRRRCENAARYNALLANAPVVTPFVPAYQRHVYHQYTILCNQRDRLKAFLAERGVSTAVYYPVPLHLQECFKPLGYRPGSLPVTEEVCGRVLSLPCHPVLRTDDLEYVAACIEAFYSDR
jgi:dTDP-4-amino-4,6-dideoxygalactose transaminase